MSLVVAINGQYSDYSKVKTELIRRSKSSNPITQTKSYDDNSKNDNPSAYPTSIETYKKVLQSTKSKDLKDFHARDILTSSLITLSPSSIVSDAIKIFREDKISHLPLIENDLLHGIVSVKDLLTAEHAAPLSDYATKEVIMARTSTTIREVAEVLIANNISAMPIINSQDKLKGIITKSDLAKFLTTHMTLNFWG